MMKKICCIVLTCSLCILATSCNKDKDVERTPFTFAVFSDIHLQLEDQTAEKFLENAIKDCNERAIAKGNKLDAVVIAGDLCDDMWYQTLLYEDEEVSNNKNHRDESLEYIVSCFDKYLPEGTELLYSLGNHDMVTNDKQYNLSSGTATEGRRGISSQKYYEAFAKSERNYFKNDDQTDHSDYEWDYSQMVKNGLRYARINGVNFVMIDNDKYWVEEYSYNSDQLSWLDQTLAYISKTYANEPIFVITHNPVQNSVLHTEDNEGDKDLDNILIKYPQTITFTGHIHKSNYSEYGISQEKGFTCVESTCLKCCNVSSYGDGIKNPDDGRKSYYDVLYCNDSTASSEGLLVTVNEDTSVTIERLDFLTKKKSGADWIIPAVGDSNRNNIYNETGRLNKAPYFESESDVRCEIVGDYLNVIFKHAKDLNDNVWAYRVKAYNNDGSLIKEVVVSEARAIPELNDCFYVSFENQNDISYVTVAPEDSLYMIGSAIRVNKDAFVKETKQTFNTKKSTNSNLGSVSYNGYTFNESTCFTHEGNTISNIKSSYAEGNSYFDFYDTGYKFSFKISNARCNRGATANGKTLEGYRLGACLASYVYNGRQYSYCVSLDFSHTDVGYRTETNKLSYYLMVTTPSGYTYSHVYEMGSVDLVDASSIKAKIQSEAGATLTVKRSGSTFETYLDGTLLDTLTLKDEFINNMYIPFNDDTISTFGIAAYGGEAIWSDFEILND